MFLAQVSHCFTEELSELANELMNLLKLFSTNLSPEVRMVSFIEWSREEDIHLSFFSDAMSGFDSNEKQIACVGHRPVVSVL